MKNVKINDIIVIGAAGVTTILLYKVGRLTNIIPSGSDSKVIKQLTDPKGYWKPNYYKVNGGTILTQKAAEEFAKKIYDSLGFFYDDVNTILSVFYQLKSKTQVSFLSDVFQKKYNRDLLNFLNDGAGLTWLDGLSDSNMQKIIDYTDKLASR